MTTTEPTSTGSRQPVAGHGIVHGHAVAAVFLRLGLLAESL